MKILAVSDVEDKRLEKAIDSHDDGLKSVDYIFSCGDLNCKYLEYITDGINKSLYFVPGNHFTSDFCCKDCKPEHFYCSENSRLQYGGINIHGHVEIVGDYIVAGFGGAMRYNHGVLQFEEPEMAELVKRAARKIRIRRIIDAVFFRKRKEIIAVSHAPIAGVHDKEDKCHSGFKAFRDFVFEMKPILWLHGHVHFEGQNKQQESVLDGTLVVNAYSSKIIEINGSRVATKQIYDK